jgi:hypothetical protein
MARVCAAVLPRPRTRQGRAPLAGARARQCKATRGVPLPPRPTRVDLVRAARAAPGRAARRAARSGPRRAVAAPWPRRGRVPAAHSATRGEGPDRRPGARRPPSGVVQWPRPRPRPFVRPASHPHPRHSPHKQQSSNQQAPLPARPARSVRRQRRPADPVAGGGPDSLRLGRPAAGRGRRRGKQVVITRGHAAPWRPRQRRRPIG